MNREEYWRTNWADVRANRSRFKAPFDVITSFNTGDIVPLRWDEVYPGDGIMDDISYMVRLFTPLAPFMSRVYFDVYAFFVPYRIVWTHWEEFQGQNNSSAWTQTYEYSVPQVEVEAQSIVAGTLGDYLDLPYFSTTPESGEEVTVSDLPLRGYLMIYNDWFRDENIIAPELFSKGDTHSANVDYTMSPKKAAKFHDYFTSLLPSPQKGTPVDLGGYMPVVVGDDHMNDIFQLDEDGNVVSGAQYGLRWANLSTGGTVNRNFGTYGASFRANSTGWNIDTQSSSAPSTSGYAIPSNLQARFSITIEMIRNAAVIQHVFERLASSGSRYVESLRGLWGVTPSDASLQIPEYLGGQRFQLNVSDVISTADTVSGAAGEFLGQIGAYSKNKDGTGLVNKSFTEHGMYYVVGVVRVEQHYFQGLRRKWTRKKYFDFYMPQLSGIGNQPVYRSEINLEGKVKNGEAILGYSEAWAELRYTPYTVSGIFRPGRTGAITYYDASDIIADDVSLNQSFIEQGASGIDRCIAVPSASRGSFQWFGQFHFNTIWTRELQPHEVPGVDRI